MQLKRKRRNLDMFSKKAQNKTNITLQTRYLKGLISSETCDAVSLKENVQIWIGILFNTRKRAGKLQLVGQLVENNKMVKQIHSK